MSGKVALVTGAGRGIGRAVALALGEAGYDVGVNYHSSEQGALETCRRLEGMGRRALPLRGSVADLCELDGVFRAFFDAFGTIDLLVNNAGISKFYPFLEVTEAQWEEITFSDWKGAFFATQHAAKKMVEQGKKGAIINISSNHVDGCWPMANIYGPTKAALTKFGQNAAMELAPHGIRVVTVAPGYTDVGWPATDPIHQAKSRIPAGRFARPEEIGKLVAFLASQACDYMTGNCVTMDGGALLPVVPENDYLQTGEGQS